MSSSTGMPPAPAGVGGGAAAATRALDGLDSFEAALRNGTRARREKEEARVADLRSSILTVEQRLSEEAERHVEAARALQAWAEAQVDGVRVRLEEQLSAASADAAARTAALVARVDALEARFEADRAATLAIVETRNKDLVERLQAFHAAFEAERAARLAREAALLQRLGTAEHEASAAWEAERAEREQVRPPPPSSPFFSRAAPPRARAFTPLPQRARPQVYMTAKRRIEEAIAAREKADGKFQSATLCELAAIKSGIASEAAARAAEDDHLAATLAAYVQKLQGSLALLNTEDTAF
jgi:hypothetical protein